MMQNELDHAKALIQQKRYTEAKQVIKALKHPKEAEWLARIDEMDVKQKANSNVAETPGTSRPQIKTSKPLPLLPEEERELLPRGKPDDPQIILNEHIPIRRARLMMRLLGGKCGPLILNYFRMGRPVLGAVLMFLYIAWVTTWFFSFVIFFLLVSDHNASILILLFVLLIVVGLPFMPRLLAGVQQVHYDQWMRDFADLRRDYLAHKS